MRYEISGTVMQTVAIDLTPGETVYSQTNTMCWMNDQVEMNTHTGGGLFAGLKRSFSGGSFFVTDFTARGNGHVAFAPRFPGAIIAAQLQPGQSLIVPQRLCFFAPAFAFLCLYIAVSCFGALANHWDSPLGSE